MIEFYREPSGDYCCIDTTARQRESDGVIYDGRATAITGLLGAVQTTGISAAFLDTCCQRINRADVPPEWLRYLIGEDQ